MYYRVLSSAVRGIEGYIVDVEVDISGGFPRFDIVGLPDSSVKESADRVRTSLRNSGFELPVERITVNLAPAHLRKVGVGFDLAIAIGILACKGEIPKKKCEGVLFLGELSLSGTIQPMKGILPMIHSASKMGVKSCMVPEGNSMEASVVSGMKVIAVKDLVHAVGYLRGTINIEATKSNVESLFKQGVRSTDLDFDEVRGQNHVKRALEVAVAGMHNVMMLGPPGSGKTMMAKRVPSIMPKINYEESIDITKIRSVCELIKEGTSLVVNRPFRSPHHTISNAAMIGGGSLPKPGEISLAHNGVLFLDEMPEFNKNVLEVLRQPLEEGEVTISRVNATVKYPSKFMMIASMNPCPCGYHPDVGKCQCTPSEIKRYLSKISGPILDRIDIHIEAGKIDYQSIASEAKMESSEVIAERVMRTIQIQTERYKNLKVSYNAHLSAKEVKDFCRLDREAKIMIRFAFEKLGLSVRAYHKVLKVGRTIADLEESETISEKHIAEAIQYRSLDRKYWHNNY